MSRKWLRLPWRRVPTSCGGITLYAAHSNVANLPGSHRVAILGSAAMTVEEREATLLVRMSAVKAYQVSNTHSDKMISIH